MKAWINLNRFLTIYRNRFVLRPRESVNHGFFLTFAVRFHSFETHLILMWLIRWEKVYRLTCCGGLAEKKHITTLWKSCFQIIHTTAAAMLLLWHTPLKLVLDIMSFEDGKKILFVLKYYYYYYYIDHSEDKIQMSPDTFTWLKWSPILNVRVTGYRMSALLILTNAENIIVRLIQKAVSITALYIIYR